MRTVLILLVLGIIFVGCKDTGHDQKDLIAAAFPISEKEVPMDDLVLDQTEGKWYCNNNPFNGYSVSFYPNGQLGEKIGFYQGKKEGVAKQWSANGVLRVERHYHQNRLTGTYKSWWENGMLASEVDYVDGLLHGVAREWYPNGQLAKQRQLKSGKENGLQKAWLENGVLYVNYEAKHGRIYGMRRANSCYQLENEVVVQSK